ncbi:MAG: hypothetical protein H6629_14860 [Calditrichae bacterium]|nr:hypothetical protein [Calditrichia bacterium]
MDKLQLPPHWHEQYEVVSEAGGVLTWRDRETQTVFNYLVDETATTPKALVFADTLWAEKPLQSTPSTLIQPFMQTVLSGWAKRHSMLNIPNCWYMTAITMGKRNSSGLTKAFTGTTS